MDIDTNNFSFLSIPIKKVETCICLQLIEEIITGIFDLKQVIGAFIRQYEIFIYRGDISNLLAETNDLIESYIHSFLLDAVLLLILIFLLFPCINYNFYLP